VIAPRIADSQFGNSDGISGPARSELRGVHGRGLNFWLKRFDSAIFAGVILDPNSATSLSGSGDFLAFATAAHLWG
jgi:hypothetical protein